MREIEIQASIADFLRAQYPCAFVLRIPAQGIKRGSGAMAKSPLAGMPDLMLILDGRAIFFEVKRPKGQASLAQKNTHQSLRAAGAIVATVDSIEAVKLALAK